MNLYQKLDTALETLADRVSYYSALPSFPEGEEPERVLIYQLADNTVLHADNLPQEWEFTVFFTIHTPKRADLILNKAIIKAMLDGGFTYLGGGSYEFNKEYPKKAKYEMEFKIIVPFATTHEAGSEE